MNKISRLVALVALMPLCLHAQNETSTSTAGLGQDSTTSSNSRKYEVSAGYMSRDLEISSLNDQVISGKGASISAGRIFNLDNGFTATSSLVGSYLSLDPDNGNGSSDDSIDEDFLNYEVGYYQKIGYNISMGTTVIKPFVELNYSVGTYDASSSQEADEFFPAAEMSMKRNYSNYGIAGGLQVTLPNGLTPFVKYNISVFQFSRNGESEFTSGGETFTSDNIILTREERRNTTKAITAGLAYLF